MKYTAIMKKPLNVLAEFARIKWEQATPEADPCYFMTVRVFVAGNDVYLFKPRHQVGIANARAAGGKWERVQRAVIESYGGVQAWLDRIGAVPANYKGGPKL